MRFFVVAKRGGAACIGHTGKPPRFVTAKKIEGNPFILNDLTH